MNQKGYSYETCLRSISAAANLVKNGAMAKLKSGWIELKTYHSKGCDFHLDNFYYICYLNPIPGKYLMFLERLNRGLKRIIRGFRMVVDCF